MTVMSQARVARNPERVPLPADHAIGRVGDVQWLALIILAAAMVRLVGLGVFPEIQADEGLWTNSAKNFALFGEWFMDGRTHMLLSPVFHIITAGVFEVAGASLGVARIVSAVAGTVSVVLLYLLVRQLTGRVALALVAAVLFGLNEWTVVLARRALIEPMQLMWVLGAALLLTRSERWAPPAAGAVFALALLTKINAVFMLGVLGLVVLAGLHSRESVPLSGRIVRAAVFGAVSLGLAGLVYGLLYLGYPERFISAFRYELDGAHFSADPLVRLGRFGLDPVLAGRTLIELIREAPYLTVLASIGCGISLVTRPRSAGLFGVWLVLGAGFVLIQTFQPIRYLYLAAPPIAYFAAVPFAWLADDRRDAVSQRIAVMVLAIALCFDLSYLGMNAVANRGIKLPTVRAWAERELGPDDRVLAAGYLATDLPGRAYAHYHLARTTDQLAESIERYGITYVVYDRDEWRGELGDFLARRYRPVAEWSFGTVYRVAASPSRRDTAGQQ